LRPKSNGYFLTQDDNSATFAIILHNVRTYRSGGVVAVVHGRRHAESTLKEFQGSQSPSDYHEGWRYFFEKTDLAAGTDPAEATRRRQAELERREAKESQNSSMPPSSFGK
jgi:hypothetical protein